MTTLPLDTAPGPSPDEEAVRNAGISAELLEKAWAELAAGDLLQASEKAWGAAAWAIKTVAERRRWFSEADWKLRRAATIIAAEMKEPGIMRCYSLARDVHFNYYRHEYHAPEIEPSLVAAADLVALLAPALAVDYQPPYVDAATETLIRTLEQPTSAPDRHRLTNGRPPINARPPVG